MKRLIFTSLMLAGFLSACTQLSSPPQTLEQKLAHSTTPDERRETLRLACLNEADYTTRLKKAAHQKRYGSKGLAFVRDTDETIKFKALCRKMTETNSGEQKAALAGECRQEVEAGLKEKSEYKQHYDAMQNICTKMTVKYLP